MLVGVDLEEDKLRVSHYDSDGRLKFIKKQINADDMFKWNVTEQPTRWKTWNNAYIYPSMTNRLSRFRLEELMLKYIKGDSLMVLNEFNKPKIAYLDIENYVNQNNDFTKPELAEFPINIISVLVENCVYVLTTLPQMSPDDIRRMECELNAYFKKYNTAYTINYQFFQKELHLLTFFCHHMLPKLGFITGWNVLNYDWQYITNRCQKLDIDLTKKLPSSDLGINRIPTHTAMIDYIEAVMTMRSVKDLENMSLETVSNKVLDVAKLHNPHKSFYDFINDTYMFTLYNMIDSCLIQLIENKTSTLDRSFAIAKIANIELSRTFSSVYMTEMFLCRQFYNNGIFLPDIRKKKVQKDFKYSGAYVKQPIPGFYEYVSCFDFNSMYPNIAVQFNISPETYLGMWDKIDKSTLPANYTRTVKGTTFDNTYDSATRSLLIKYYDTRKMFQKNMAGIEDELKELRSKLQCVS
jgi:DNA polymerase elongation subunit (family B)